MKSSRTLENSGVLEPFLNYTGTPGPATEELYRLSFLSAYDALPTASLGDSEEFWATYYLAKHPAVAWFVQLCLLTETEASPAPASTFQWHKGRLPNGREYMVCEYPKPRPRGLTAGSFEEGELSSDLGRVLAPYFSAVLRKTTTGPASCFALGQSPVDGVTSLRRCTAAASYSLGRGPEPTLNSFLEVLEEAEDLAAEAATIRYQDRLTDLDVELLDSLPEDSLVD